MDWMQWAPRYTVTYCQYGDTRMKPTDIFTNHPDPRFKPPCRNGDPCHTRAPRGARTGTQGLSKIDRSRIPDELCDHVVSICEDYVSSLDDANEYLASSGRDALTAMWDDGCRQMSMTMPVGMEGASGTARCSEQIKEDTHE